MRIKHLLTAIDEASKSADCSVCGRIRIFFRTEQQAWTCTKRPAIRSMNDRRGHPMQHVLSEIDESRLIGVCAKCGPVRIYPADGTRARKGGQKWCCSRRPQEKKVGGPPTNHVVTVLNEAEKLGTCSLCGPVKLIWRPFTAGGGRWGCFRTRFSIDSMSAYKWGDDYKAAICPFCLTSHRWDRDQGKKCRAKLVEKFGNVCGVCGDEFTETPRVDHDHKTGAVRGLLHRNCNVALGLLRDDPDILQKAIDYLKKS